MPSLVRCLNQKLPKYGVVVKIVPERFVFSLVCLRNGETLKAFQNGMLSIMVSGRKRRAKGTEKIM
jgi:hypothetical protein